MKLIKSQFSSLSAKILLLLIMKKCKVITFWKYELCHTPRKLSILAMWCHITTHILVSTGLSTSLFSVQHQTCNGTNSDIIHVEPLGTGFSDILSKINLLIDKKSFLNAAILLRDHTRKVYSTCHLQNSVHIVSVSMGSCWSLQLPVIHQTIMDHGGSTATSRDTSAQAGFIIMWSVMIDSTQS